jgi:DNA-binding NarL/FixJ family response regulator
MEAAKLKVLIVDDSSFIRMGVRHYLEDREYILSEAANAEEAMRHLNQEKFDVVILDISLQVGPDGKEGLILARKIKTQTPAVGIILLSGSLNHYQEFLEIIKNNRGIAYLYKGSNFKDELLAVIDMVLKGGVWVAPEIANYKNNSATVSLSDSEHKKIDCVLCFFYLLSNREREIVQLLAASNDNTAIAEKLCISLNTVSSHLSNIYSKVGLGEKLSRSEKRSLLTKACLMNQSK